MNLQYFIGACIILASASLVNAQQPPATQPPVNQPIELPEFIVTGTDRVDIPGSVKQTPSKPPIIGAARLDSLNPVEKQPVPVLPPKPLAAYSRTQIFYPGWLQASFGQYLTPDVTGGYSLDASGYRIDANALFTLSDGWAANTSYSKVGVQAVSSYVAPEKFIVFGGSTTEVDVGYTGSSYKLFGATVVQDRCTSTLHAKLEVDGAYSGYKFDAGAGFESSSLQTGERNVGNTDITGFASVMQQGRGLAFGVMADVAMRSFDGNPYPMFTAAARGRYANETVQASAYAGFQNAMSTTGISRGGLLLSGTLDVFLGMDLSLRAKVKSGLRAITYQSLIQESLYLSDSLVLDAAYDIADISGAITYHPVREFYATANIRFKQSERDPVWIPTTEGSFSVEYTSSTKVELGADIRWLLSSTDIVLADVLLTSATLADYSSQPYVAPLRFSATYTRTWTDVISSKLMLVYVGNRYANLANTTTLSGYLDARVHVGYAFSPKFNAFVAVDNLLGSTIILWDNYHERGLFARAGITLAF